MATTLLPKRWGQRREFTCCKPASEWCRRDSMESAIAHAHERADLTAFRQQVRRSFAHEAHTDGRQFWLIQSTCPRVFCPTTTNYGNDCP